ncbi:gluconokinase [Rhodobacter sp.]
MTPGPLRLVVMGVSGCGKSTLGAALAARLGADFIDADTLHPPANLAKMAAGVPLTDADRWPRLEAVAQALSGPAPLVVACSALRRIYRDRLRAAEGVRFLHLAAPQAVILARMQARRNHFMPASLLASQYETLEPPGPDEAITLDAVLPVAALTEAALRRLAPV